jgi:hypothetical protein
MELVKLGRIEKNIIHNGQKFGRLTVIKIGGYDKYGHKLYKCICSCGKEKIVLKNSLIHKLTRSCGCLFLEEVSNRFKTHGWSCSSDPLKNKFWKVFKEINKRCHNPNSKSYPYYGGRGIKTIWRKFENFRTDMWKSYKSHIKKYGIKNTTIDRIKTNGHYNKKNTRWATWKIQQNNKRSTIYVTYMGKKMSIGELSKHPNVISKVKYATLLRRINVGWPIEDAVKSHAEKYFS